MTGLRILVALVLVATVLSGCSGKAVEETVVVRPE
jgi:PBP1b-binding outer membrane lipoprotein LpoB